MARAETIGELKATGYVVRSVREEMRRNLMARLAAGAPILPGMVGYDDKFVYVAVSAQDGTLVRTAGAGAAEDHASLLLSIPTSGGRFAKGFAHRRNQPG